MTTRTAEYTQYLRSPEWREFRIRIIAERAYRCQDCLEMGSEKSLQVHHLHYDSLGMEEDDDVLVLCPPCHEKADRERKAKVRREIYVRRRDAWISKVFGEECPPEDAEERFDAWLARQ